MVRVHTSVSAYSEEFLQSLRRHNYVTPKNYLDYIANYCTLLKKNRPAGSIGRGWCGCAATS